MRLLFRAHVAPDHPAHLAQVDLLREWRSGRHDGEREEAVELPWSSRQELAVDREDLRGGFNRPERRASDDGPHLVQAEQERGHHAEVAAAAPDRPVQVGVLVGVRDDLLPAREDDLGLEQVVDR